MNRHKNARTTPYGRALMVRRVRELGWSAARAAEAAGVACARCANGSPVTAARVQPGCSIARRGRAARRRGSPRAGRP